MSKVSQRRWALAWRVTLALFGFAVGILNLLAARKLVPLSVFWQIAIIVALGAVTFGDNVRLAYRRYNSPRRLAVHQRAQKAVVSLLFALWELEGISPQFLGASIFRVRKSRILRRQRLERVFRFRIAAHPQPTTVKWTKGKGVIGEAWDTKRRAYKYRRAIANAWGGKQVTDSEFQKIRAETRGEFTREEFVAIVDKYAEVCAVPILSDDGAVLGVLSVDVSMGAPTGRYLDGKGVEAQMAIACSMLRPDIDRLYT